jgi:hypothetical protein
MFVEISLHSFIMPDQKLVDKLTEKTGEGDLFLFSDLKMAVEGKYLLCFGWVNYVKYENGLVIFGCRVLEDTDKQIAINYKTVDGVKEIVNLYLV